MNEIEKIKQRIKKRKQKVDINYDIKKVESKKSTTLFKVIMATMSVYALFMSFALYAKKDESATFLNSVFNTEINFKGFNRTLNKLFNLRIIDNVDDEMDDMVVSSDIRYVSLGDDYFTSDGNIIASLEDGVVTYVNGKDESYTIIVEYDNGIRATYNEVNEVNVFVNDRVYKDDILGSFNEKVQIVFIKDNKKISYEEVLEFI